MLAPPEYELSEFAMESAVVQWRPKVIMMSKRGRHRCMINQFVLAAANRLSE
jgi:hypothetical protein